MHVILLKNHIAGIKQATQWHGVLLFLLGPHIGSNNKLLHGEVENQRSNRGVKYRTRQELVR